MTNESDKLWEENKKKIDALIKEIKEENKKRSISFEDITRMAKESLKGVKN